MPPVSWASKALEKMRNELAMWKDFNDWQWACRFAYQVIEKRGTGGGGFRLMYADFLEDDYLKFYNQFTGALEPWCSTGRSML
jgi:hypothetical protein